MGPNYIALAIPLFFVCIVIELLAARALGRRVYRLGDALGDVGAGIVSELAKVFVHGALLAGYIALYQRRLFQLPERSVWLLLVVIVAVDFFYYWWHRLSHEVNFLWAAHVVHHTSEDYNLAVALRQSITTHFTAIPFYLPLGLVGVPPSVYLAAFSINLLYQFWIHTELVRSLGPLERVMNTPSHHRVHHAINPQYLDKNYAGIFIVWDRLFGTFIEEDQEKDRPVYGTVKPLASFNPAWIQVHYFVDLVRDAWRAPVRGDGWRLWLASPEWHPRGLGGYPSSEAVSRATFRKYDPRVSRAMMAWLAAWFLAALALATAIIWYQDQWSIGRLALGAALVAATGLWEGRRWARPFGVALAICVLVAIAVIGGTAMAAPVATERP